MSKRIKKSKPTCLLIPGMGEKTSERPYREIRRYFEMRGWKVVGADISWKRTTLTGWLRQVSSIANGRNFDAVFGFSFGALLSLLSAADLGPRYVIAASPSPYFKEQLSQLPPFAEKFLGRRRMQDFRKYSMKSLSKVQGARVHILVAEHDFPLLKTEAPKVKKLLGHEASLQTVRGAVHDLGGKDYLHACKKIISTLKKNRAV